MPKAREDINFPPQEDSPSSPSGHQAHTDSHSSHTKPGGYAPEIPPHTPPKPASPRIPATSTKQPENRRIREENLMKRFFTDGWIRLAAAAQLRAVSPEVLSQDLKERMRPRLALRLERDSAASLWGEASVGTSSRWPMAPELGRYKSVPGPRATRYATLKAACRRAPAPRPRGAAAPRSPADPWSSPFSRRYVGGWVVQLSAVRARAATARTTTCAAWSTCAAPPAAAHFC